MSTIMFYIIAIGLYAQGGLVQADPELDTLDAGMILGKEIAKIMDIDHIDDLKLIPTFPMQMLNQEDYTLHTNADVEPRGLHYHGIISNNSKANMARLTDVLHVNPMGEGPADPGQHNQKLSDLASKVLDYAKLKDPDTTMEDRHRVRIAQFRKRISSALTEHDAYSESWARSPTQPSTIHQYFETEGRNAWTRMMQSFVSTQWDESASVSAPSTGSFCYKGIVCAKAPDGMTREKAESESKGMRVSVELDIAAMEVMHSWFPFEIMDDERLIQASYAAGAWHMPNQWNRPGWRKNGVNASVVPLLAFRSKVIFCKNIKVSMQSSSTAIMETMGSSKNGDGIDATVPMFGAPGSVKSTSEKQAKGQKGRVDFEVNGVGICGYVLRQLSRKGVPVNDDANEVMKLAEKTEL